MASLRNVQDILENFKFRNQMPTLSRPTAIGTLISKVSRSRSSPT